MLKRIVSSKLFWFCIVSIILVLIEIVLFSNTKFQSNFERFSIIGQYIFGSITVVGILLAVWQIQESIKKRKIEIEVIKTEKSLEMMDLFANLLNDLSFISSIYDEDSEYRNILTRYKHYEFREFTMQQLNKLFNEKDRSILCDFGTFVQRNFHNIVQHYKMSFEIEKEELDSINRFDAIGWDLAAIRAKIKARNDVTTEVQMKAIFENERSMMNYLREKINIKLQEVINKSLNKLEYFSAFFMSEIADDEIVNQSLHQVFLSTVMNFYPRICEYNNTDSTDEFYTNLTGLYKKWSEKYKESQNQIEIQKNAAKKTKRKAKFE